MFFLPVDPTPTTADYNARALDRTGKMPSIASACPTTAGDREVRLDPLRAGRDVSLL